MEKLDRISNLVKLRDNLKNEFDLMPYFVVDSNLQFMELKLFPDKSCYRGQVKRN